MNVNVEQWACWPLFFHSCFPLSPFNHSLSNWSSGSFPPSRDISWKCDFHLIVTWPVILKGLIRRISTLMTVWDLSLVLCTDGKFTPRGKSLCGSHHSVSSGLFLPDGTVMFTGMCIKFEKITNTRSGVYLYINIFHVYSQLISGADKTEWWCILYHPGGQRRSKRYLKKTTWLE